MSHSRTLTAIRTLGVLIISVLAVSTLTGAAMDINPVFEIDENITTDSGPGLPDDWDRIYLGTDNSLVTTGILIDPPGFTRFTGGSKDIDDVSGWRWDDNNSPDKDEITDAYAALYEGNVFAFGADRYATNGDAQIGFWLLQGDVGPVAGGGFSGNHVFGDILVLSDFTQGGGTATIKVFRWVGSGGSDGTLDEITVDPTNASAVVNEDPVVSLWPYTPKSGTAGTFPVGAFFEGAVDLGALGVSGCFSSFIAETRSSQSVIAELKDFVFGEFDVVPRVSLADTTFCEGEFVEICPVVIGGVPPYSYEWNTGETTECITVSEGGEYCVTVTGANECSAEPACATATVLPPPACSITGPEATCPADTNTYCAPEGMDVYSWSIIGNGSIITPTDQRCVDVVAGTSCGETFTVTVAITDTNGCQNECDLMVMVEDNEAPTITCPDSVFVQCIDDVPDPDTGLVTADDNCSVEVRWDGDVSDGQTCPETIARTYIARDGCGNETPCTQYIVIHDTTAPDLTCPPDKSYECTGQGGYVPAEDWKFPSASLQGLITAGGSVSDNCDTEPEVTYDLAGPEGDCPKVWTLTWRATDECGNSSSCQQRISENDTQPPTITCPDSVFVQCIGDVPDPDTGLVSASDSCDTEVEVTFEGDASDGQTCPETIARTYRATDDCGNYADCVQYIVVDDTTAPVISCPDTLHFECDAVGDFGTATADDNCDSEPDVSYEDEVIQGNCPQESTIVRTWTAVDDCGNESQCVQAIYIEDTTAPEITCADPETVGCGETPVFTDPRVSDNCDPEPRFEVVGTDTIPDVGGGGFTVRRCWKGIDACGNESDECCQSIYVEPCGGYCTYTQGGWGSGCPDSQSGDMASTQPGCIRDHYFNEVFPNGVRIGDPGGVNDGDGFFAVLWTGPDKVEAFLPAGTTLGTLSKDDTNPTETDAGVLAGQLLALTLNVYIGEAGIFDQLGLLPDAGSVGDAVISSYCGDKFAGMTVYDFLALANQAISGNTSVLGPYGASLSDVNNTASCINEMFDECRMNIPDMPVDYNGEGELDRPVSQTPGLPTANIPAQFTVEQAYPNPFTNVCNIRFGLPTEGRITVDIFDVAGRRIASIADVVKPAGFHTVVWDGRNSSGQRVADGIYFYRVKFGSEMAIKKMIMLQ